VTATVEAVTAALLKKAQDEATAAVEKVTTLRGVSARKVAHAVLTASGEHLRAEQTVRLGARPDAVGLSAAVVVFGIDLALYAAVVAGKHPRALRPAAGVALVARAGLFAYAHYQRRKLRARINTGLAAGGLK
jgi:hypothetical protein